jgi:outer membrane protein TolC
MAQPFSFPVVLDDLVMQASLTVPLSDYVLRVPHVTRVAEQQRDAARAARAASTLQVGADGRLLFYGWARAQLQRAVAAQALEQASAHLRDVDAAVAAQTATAADRLRVESQRASAELLVLRATHLVALLADQLRTALHDTGGEPYVLGEDLDAEPDPTPAGLASIEQAFGDALVRRPELVQAAAAEGAEAAQRRAVRSGGWPRLEAFGEILAGSPHPRFFPPSSVFRTTWAVGVQMAWSPNELLSSAAASRAGAAREEARRAQRALVAEQIRIEVVRAFQAWRESEAARRTAVRGLAAAEEAYRVRREQFRAGRATSVELIDAETNLTRARLEAVDARVDARIARVQLLRATGRG